MYDKISRGILKSWARGSDEVGAGEISMICDVYSFRDTPVQVAVYHQHPSNSHTVFLQPLRPRLLMHPIQHHEHLLRHLLKHLPILLRTPRKFVRMPS